MAELGINFDATTVDPSAGFPVYPPGDYICHAVKSDMVDTKPKFPETVSTGKMLVIEWDILEGEFAGNKLWTRLNLVNKNPQAVTIAQGDLSAVCHATGQMHVSNSEQLHFKPISLKVVVKPAGNDKQGVWREAQNEIKGFDKHIAKAGYRAPARTASAAQATAEAPAATTATGKPAGPWAQRRAAAAV
jgi:hypothetical protein